MTVVRNFTALLSDYSAWGYQTGVGKAAFITYSFPNKIPASAANRYPDAAGSFRAFTAAEKQAVRQAMAMWEEVSGIKFIEVAPGKGEIPFMFLNFNQIPGKASAAGFAYYPSGTWSSTTTPGGGNYFDAMSQGGVFIDRSDYVSGEVGDDLHILIHEIGHALGLKHPFDGDPTLPTSLDNAQHSVMSYTGRLDRLGSFDDNAARALYGGPLDAQGISWSWNKASKLLTASGSTANNGIRGTTEADRLSGKGGNDTLSGVQGRDTLKGGAGNDLLIGGDGNDTLKGDGGRDRIDGGAGTDTADYSNEGKAIFLRPASSSYSDRKVVIAGQKVETLSDIEKFIGSKFGDTLKGTYWDGNFLSGGPGNDKIAGGYDNDTLAGGRGSDTYLFVDEGSYYSFTLDLGKTAAQQTGQGIDRISGFENARGASGDDSLTGSTKGNKLEGMAGDDVLQGMKGNDRLFGGADDDVLTGALGNDLLDGASGDDQLFGGFGGDTLRGDAGNDTLEGGGGNDLIYGGTGTDQANYDGARSRYQLSERSDGGVRVVDTGDGNAADILYGVEKIDFGGTVFNIADLL
ncbi:MAG: hypothetical protein C0606_04530 [Hyphomicrobiales bacterium]|nr:MAG: hypothetical protein C0606_04530 [Hyphomicrobiales bacterium]